MSNSGRRDGGHSSSSFETVAGNGLIHRRALLGSGLALAGAASTGVSLTGAAAEPLKDDPWSQELGDSDAGAADAVAVREACGAHARATPSNEMRTSHARTPHQLLNGTVTPNSLHFTINHSGIPDIDPSASTGW